MDIGELRKKSAKEGIPQAIVEKDYVLSIVLKELSESPLRDNLVFKGGTAIKKVYFKEARFSEDLDFTVLNLEKRAIVKQMRNIFENRGILNVSFKDIKEEKTTAGLRVSLRFVSLLQQPQRIRFDFSFRENIVLKPLERELIDDYSLGKTVLRVLSLEELLAEKIHALFWRTAPRDLYDIWFLLNKGIKTNPEITKKKFAYYNERFELDKLYRKLSALQTKWKQRLRQFIKEVPEFDIVSKNILESLDQTFT